MEIKTEVSVIVPARDARLTLPDTLEALARQTFAGRFEVIVVDDGSMDGTGKLAGDHRAVTRVLRLEGRGPAAARNAGALAAGAAKLAFLDADCRPTPGWLAAGTAALSGADLVLGETRPRAEDPVGPFDRTLTVVGCSPLFESANLFVVRDLFDGVGGFESWLGPRTGKELGEDVWFGWRARRAGATVRACPEALAHHVVEKRGMTKYAAERWRLRFFPALVRRVPELRRELFYARVFLNPRAAAFDAAVASLAATRLTRRRWLAAGALPYALVLSRDLREPHGPAKLVGRSLADAVGLAALVVGSLRDRTLLL
jgi:glycosyltransferase involved in cell wall biosynthesis